MSDDPVRIAELVAAKRAARNFVNQTAYGAYISDDLISQLASVIVTAVDQARAKLPKT
jgi:hypothetical protein